MTVTLVLMWLSKNWRLLVAGLLLAGIGWCVWEIRSTYAERDRLSDQVASLRIEVEMLRSNASTAAQLRIAVQQCLDDVAKARLEAERWLSRYHKLLAARPDHQPGLPPATLPDSTCEDAARQYAAWLLGEVSHAP